MGISTTLSESIEEVMEVLKVIDEKEKNILKGIELMVKSGDLEKALKLCKELEKLRKIKATVIGW